ncbi:uncharacterized protein LOC128957930 [Oppia nitens]|uniref:uncharacterized protein LOC128957930 n=1 Tax=Oppia nitens TaxID=1686743 RepID=UPI0023DB4B18|nr:uncharacterized protein LOC128957930 [Oppia nitens]
MFQVFIVVLLFVCCHAYDYNGQVGRDDYGGSHSAILTGGLSSHINKPIGFGHQSLPLSSAFGLGGRLPLGSFASPQPIHSHRSVEVAPTHFEPAHIEPQVIEVAGDDQPVQVLFRSQGAKVHIQQLHTPTRGGQVESTRTEEEPHTVVHEVVRPVIQHIREIIQPYRRVTQEVRPVLEEIHTVVAKGERAQQFASPVGTAQYAAPVAVPIAQPYGAVHGLTANTGYKSRKA